MNVLVYFSPETLSNSYVVFGDDNGEAVLVDPRAFDVPLFTLIETKGLVIRSVVLTHGTPLAARAVRTLKRIYELEVYGGGDNLEDGRIFNVHRGKHFVSAGLSFHPIPIQGHHTDSIMYQVGDYLFSGDVILAGTMANADAGYGRALLIQSMRELFNQFDDNILLLPLHGPPSSIGIERITNIDLAEDEDPQL